MNKHRLRGRPFHVTGCLALALLLLLSFACTDVSASLKFSILKQSRTTITVPPVVLQAGSAGNSTIYANSTSAQVSVSATVAQGWLSNFPYREKITFNNSAISENLVNFTVPIIFDSSNTDFWGHVQTNGNDTRFIDADNTTKLYYEFETFNHTSDDMVAWVKVPQIDASSTTDYIWIYYGNSTVNFDSYSSRSSNAWDSNYVAVYHFKDGSGSRITDSTLRNNATLHGSGSHWTNGQIGGAYNFDGTNDYAIITASTAFDVSTYTIEAWAKPNTTQAWTNIMAQNDTTTGPSKFQFSAGNSATNLASDFGGPTWHSLEATSALSNNAWNSYADRIDMANSNQSLWKNGTIAASQTQTTYPCTYANGSAIGIGADAFGAYKFKGTIDELRFSNIARSANWIKACYQYQFDRSKLTYRSVEIVGAVLKVANQVASAWNLNLRVYNSSNIARLSNAIISFRDGTSNDQIVVSNGNIAQSEGALYNLPAGAGSAVYISMSNIQTNATGTSYLYIYLKVLVPNTSTYSLYIITFLIT